MKKMHQKLPKDPQQLRKMVTSRDEEIRFLREENRLLKARLFGRKTEKLSSATLEEQTTLFEDDQEEEAVADDEDCEEITSYKRKKRGRMRLPADLPRKRIVHDVKDKTCKTCLNEKRCVSEKISERLACRPAQFWVEEHVRLTYGCLICDADGASAQMETAPAAPQLLPKTMATSSLLAMVLGDKLIRALPFYRQEAQFRRLGVPISRETLCNWFVKTADKCLPLFNLLTEDLLSYPRLQMDETHLKVMGERDRKNTTRSYMWVSRGGPPGGSIVHYQYHPTRSGSFPLDFLQNYQGVLLTDGYQGYDFLAKKPGIHHLNCLVHARRKFTEAAKLAGGYQALPKTSITRQVLDLIKKIYRWERKARDQTWSCDQVLRMRQEHTSALMDDLKALLDQHVHQVPPKLPLGKAIAYTLTRWDKLTGFLQYGDVPPDTNATENVIRPFVVGRKNWLHAASPEGAHALAIHLTLVETSKANGWEPYSYLEFLYEHLPLAQSLQDYERLLPTQQPTGLYARSA